QRDQLEPALLIAAVRLESLGGGEGVVVEGAAPDVVGAADDPIAAGLLAVGDGTLVEQLVEDFPVVVPELRGVEVEVVEVVATTDDTGRFRHRALSLARLGVVRVSGGGSREAQGWGLSPPSAGG